MAMQLAGAVGVGNALAATQAMNDAKGRFGGATAEGEDPEKQEDPKEQGCCFPCEPFKIFGGLCCWLPETFKKIQDCTHCTLVMGVLVAALLILQEIFELRSPGECISDSDRWACAPEITTIIFAFLLASYVQSVVSQWDGQLMQKEAAAKQAKEALLGSYNDLLSDMDGLLSNATESASGLAERSFESKRRDFQRFMERAKGRFSGVADPGSADEAKMILQFKKFCLNWLKVFSECSIDPVNHPNLVVKPEEFEKCVTVREVADLCLERLRATEVRFISAQRDADKSELASNQRVFKRQAGGGKSPKAIKDEQAAAKEKEEEEAKEGEAKNEACCKQPSWCKCGFTGVTCQCSGYPGICAALCIELQLLSKQHMQLVFVFFLGLAIIGIQAYRFYLRMQADDGDKQLTAGLSIFMVLIVQYTVVVVLLKFDEIDLVQKLEREVNALRVQNEEVAESRRKMKEFWNNAQNLTELWLYRTVPRLDLYKELHSQLEDVEEEDLLTSMAGANQALENLEANLGQLEAWRGDGALQTEDKKLFGKTMNELCQLGHMGNILQQLENDVIKGPVMYKLKDLK